MSESAGPRWFSSSGGRQTPLGGALDPGQGAFHALRLMPGQSLATLDVGESAAVTEVQGHGGVKVRILEMGFVPGTPVRLVKRAPLGDPLQFELRGYHISLRRAEASRVMVTRS